MSTIKRLIENIQKGKYEESFRTLYPIGWKEQPERYVHLAQGFQREFGSPKEEPALFSSPGRTEIGGNHTDHQRGKVLGAAVHMDTAAVAVKTTDETIDIFSEGYGRLSICWKDLEKKPEEINTTEALVRGICYRLQEQGYLIGGFQAYVNSHVPVGSGLSSSAAFENLMTTILNSLYNEGVLTGIEIAQIGQYAENEYFGKPSGLLDQGTSGVGGMVTIDFQDPEYPKVEKIDFNPKRYGYTLCIVNTGGDHADLTQDYAEIFNELQEVSRYFGKEVLREIPYETFLSALPQLRKKVGERALVRAFHIYSDNHRVDQQLEAIQSKDFQRFLRLVNESGVSSFTQLQNVYSVSHPTVQPLSLALSYSQTLLEGRGAWRVHGGGFAGTIQCYVPEEELDYFQVQMDRVFGEGSCQPVAVRPVGSTMLSEN